MSDQEMQEAQRLEFVAWAIARGGGFHDADWSTALTEQERQRYRQDARAAIAAIREYDAVVQDGNGEPPPRTHLGP